MQRPGKYENGIVFDAKKRLGALKKERDDSDVDVAKILDLAGVQRSPYLLGVGKRGKNKKGRWTGTMNPHARKASRTLQNGMYNGLASSSRPWHKLKLEDEELSEYPPVREFLDELQKRIYLLAARSGFYRAFKHNCGDLGLTGVCCGTLEEHWEYGGISQGYAYGEYWLALNDAQRFDTMYRVVPMTIQQLAQFISKDGTDPDWSLVKAEYKSRYDNNHVYDRVDLYQAVEPNPDYRPGVLGPMGKRYRSVYFDPKDDRCLPIRFQGYHTRPFWATNWESKGGEVYSGSPGYDSLGDMQELQMQSKRKAEATDWSIYPEKIVPAGVKLQNRPRSVVSAADVDKDRIIIPYQIDPRLISLIGDDVQRLEGKIDEDYYADLFMAITNMEGVQPRNIQELAARNEEKLTQLGSVVDNVNTDILEVFIDRAVDILERGDALPDTSQLPPEMNGQSLKVEFISILTQLQRAIGLGTIERVVGFVGNIAGAFPDAVRKINIYDAIDDYAERAGAPAAMINSTDEVMEAVAVDAQKEQMMQAAEMAPAMKQGAEAAKLMSELREDQT